ARLYAEDPDRGFLPSTGRLVALEFPAGEGIRVDTGVEAGADITPYYDPMIAKVITHARTREGALERLSDALDRTIVVGPRSNAGFLAQLARAREFREGKFDTGFIARNLAVLTEKRQRDASAVALAAQTFIERERTRIAALAESDADAPPSPWDEMAGFQLGGERITSLPLMADGEPLTAQVHYDARGAMVTVDAMPPARDAKIIEAGDAIYVVRKGRQTRVVRRRTEHSGGVDTGDGQIRAPMHGKILSIFVEKGTQVTRGQRLAIMEAMKMEHTLTAPVDGVVVEVAAAAHMQIAEGALVMRIESE
ncbi:MAG: carbamoyl-phosphate synthase subunit L, partial [Pseudolabrys sp.]|nr:carbamoyl-phosphate synthase subunit L [Pseudolabrys sp.]